jgi:UDP-perosamine 4-acetyltransferase
LNGKHRYFLLGAGGHASVIFNVARSLNIHVSGVVVPDGITPTRDFDLPITTESSLLTMVEPTEAMLLNGVGARPGHCANLDVFIKWRVANFHFRTLIDPAATVRDDVELGEGVAVIAGAIVQTGASLGNSVIVNTAAVVEHDCRIEEGSFVGPNATLCGGVKIGTRVFVGAGATVLPNVKIGDDVIIGAGYIVKRDVASQTKLTHSSG